MIFNGIEKDFIRVNIDLFRPPTPPIEFLTHPRRKGGSRVKEKRFRDMILPVPVTIDGKGRTIEELKEEMTDWLIQSEAKKLEFKDSPNRYYLAEYESMELDERKYRARGNINFYLPVALRFGANKSIDITTTPTTHEITGQTETPWEVEVLFTENTDKFELITDKGLYLLLGYSFIQGDRLTIKYEGREVWLNGEDLRHAVRLKTNYEMLEPGFIEISASHECEVIYDERYY